MIVFYSFIIDISGNGIVFNLSYFVSSISSSVSGFNSTSLDKS